MSFRFFLQQHNSFTTNKFGTNFSAPQTFLTISAHHSRPPNDKKPPQLLRAVSCIAIKLIQGRVERKQTLFVIEVERWVLGGGSRGGATEEIVNNMNGGGRSATHGWRYTGPVRRRLHHYRCRRTGTIQSSSKREIGYQFMFLSALLPLPSSSPSSPRSPQLSRSRGTYQLIHRVGGGQRGRMKTSNCEIKQRQSVHYLVDTC